MTTDLLTDEQVAEIERRCVVANAVVSAINNGEQWRMSIPAQPNTDPDLLISASLADISALLRDRAALIAELSNLHRLFATAREKAAVEAFRQTAIAAVRAKRDEWLELANRQTGWCQHVRATDEIITLLETLGVK